MAAVVDGDTLRLHDGRLLRLIGVNTPELGRDGRPHQPLAMEARRALQQLLGADSRIYYLPGEEPRDRYGRLLASVYSQPAGGHAGAALLSQGLAWQVVVPPNVALADCLAAAEAEARAAGRGVWALAAYRPRSVTSLAAGEGGFMRLRGRVSAVAESRRAWWLELDGALSLRLDKRDLERFGAPELQGWRGRELNVRGWVIYRGPNKRGYPPHLLHLRHPLMLESAD